MFFSGVLVQIPLDTKENLERLQKRATKMIMSQEAKLYEV